MATTSSSSDNDPPEPILPRIAAGEPHAMEDLIHHYGGLVFTIAKRLVHNDSTAEDITQETFTRLWKVAGKYNQSIASERTFISMIAKRISIDFLRKEGRRPNTVQLPDPEILADFTEVSMPRCDQDVVDEALNNLPPETKTALELHFKLGLTHQEIADKTKTPIGTVKTRLRRGLNQLKETFARLERPPP